MISYKKIFLIILICSLGFLFAQTEDQQKVPLSDEGFIPAWIVGGPFEQPITGFGTLSDTDIIGEENIQPFIGKKEKSGLVKDSVIEWFPQSILSNGFIDFNKTLYKSFLNSIDQYMATKIDMDLKKAPFNSFLQPNEIALGIKANIGKKVETNG
ncbi:MAG: hypothetical protein ABI550_09615, partial [Ignavibacteriaceae bacterium]